MMFAFSPFQSGRRPVLAPVRFVALFALFSVSALGQTGTGTVEGRVLNPATGDYVLNARVSVKGTDRVVLTDATGGYHLSDLPAGSVTLRVMLPGLDEQER